MASQTNANGVLFESDVETPDLALAKAPVHEAGNEKWDTVYVWHIIIYYPIVCLVGLYGGYIFLVSAKWLTDVFGFCHDLLIWQSVSFKKNLRESAMTHEGVFLYIVSVLGVTAGTHRLWSHRSYKAKWPLQVILIIFQTISLQYSALNWVRDHRMHHKYTDTDADPHNATRGFFFSHIGWLMMEKHPEYERKVKGLDLSDVESNPILCFQKKYYVILVTLIGVLLPTAIPVYIWNETWTNAFLVVVCFRLTLASNGTLLVNSAAHKWGFKPYDKNMLAVEVTPLSFAMLGEGYHNYHHAFPWDFKAAELGILNFTATFIEFFARIGWAYDLKTVSEEIIQKRVMRTGDGSHQLWGWGDKDQTLEDVNAAVRINPKDE